MENRWTGKDRAWNITFLTSWKYRFKKLQPYISITASADNSSDGFSFQTIITLLDPTFYKHHIYQESSQILQNFRRNVFSKKHEKISWLQTGENTFPAIKNGLKTSDFWKVKSEEYQLYELKRWMISEE